MGPGSAWDVTRYAITKSARVAFGGFALCGLRVHPTLLGRSGGRKPNGSWQRLGRDALRYHEMGFRRVWLCGGFALCSRRVHFNCARQLGRKEAQWVLAAPGT